MGRGIGAHRQGVGMARRDLISAYFKDEARLRVAAARGERPWPVTGTPLADKVAALLRLEPGSQMAYWYTDHVLALRRAYQDHRPSTGGRPALARPWADLIELAWMLFRDSNRPATSYRNGAFVEFMRVVFGVVPPKSEIIAVLRRVRGR